MRDYRYPLGLIYDRTSPRMTSTQGLEVAPELEERAAQIRAGWSDAQHYERRGVPVPVWLDPQKAADQGGQYELPHYSVTHYSANGRRHARPEPDDIQQEDDISDMVFTRLSGASEEIG